VFYKFQPGIFNVTAISTASEYDLEELMVHIVQEGLYEEKELPPGRYIVSICYHNIISSF